VLAEGSAKTATRQQWLAGAELLEGGNDLDECAALKTAGSEVPISTLGLRCGVNVTVP
jgi:hypothetical protein